MTNQEKIILKKLSLTKEWEILKKLSEELVQEIRQRPNLRDNEWDTLKSVVGNESEIIGVTKLIQIVHTLAREAK